MGMLEDQAEGLTPEEADKARAVYMHSIDPENNPDPDAPEPIPMFHPGEEPGVQPEGAYTDSVQAEIVDEEDPFAQFDGPPEEAGDEDEEDPFAQFDTPPDADSEEEDPFAQFGKEEKPPEEPTPEP